VGRTTFWEPRAALRAGKITREAAVAEIARRYRQWVDTFEQARAAAGVREDAAATARAALPQG
jgi:myo-inositol catabolism protein IolC